MASSADAPVDDDRQERLDRLYDIREDLQTIAESDAEWSKYAKEGLRTLREAGYDA